MAADERLIFVDGCWRRGGGGLADATSPSTEKCSPLCPKRTGPTSTRLSEAPAKPAFVGGPVGLRAVGGAGRGGRHRPRPQAAAGRSVVRGPGQTAGFRGPRRGGRARQVLRDGCSGRRARHGELVPSVSPERRALIMRVPLGVVGVVTPWNWPYTMMAELVAPALAAGNTVVWVPAPTTAACSSQLAAAIVDAGLPRGVFNFLPGPGPVVGAAWSAIPVSMVWALSVPSPPARRSLAAPRGRHRSSSWVATAPWSSSKTLIWSWPRSPPWRPATSAPARAARRASASSSTAQVRREFVERGVAATAEPCAARRPLRPGHNYRPAQ